MHPRLNIVSVAKRINITPLKLQNTLVQRPSTSRPKALALHRCFTRCETPRFSSASTAPLWTSPLDVKNRPVSIIGAGVLGRRLAVMWASNGRAVTLYDTNPTQLTAAAEYIADTLTSYCIENNTHPGHVHSTMDFHDAVKNSWMVIEAIPEKLTAKTALLGRVDKILPQDCIIATNSSCYKSSELVGEVKCRERVLNTHYYVPPRNTYVELMSCGETAPTIFPFLVQNMKDVGLHPIIVPKQSAGMIFNRIWGTTKRETLRVLEEGLAKPEDVDALFKDFFHAQKGPCEKMDEVGLDTVALVEKHYLSARPELSTLHLDWLEENYVRPWALGDKAGSGLYSATEKAQIKAQAAEKDCTDGKGDIKATGGQ
ncbi:hypothetical protein BP6252_10813 [Coleophoma cylindrospora]|uniref:3-hydroxyacyl-CoA dehydrogenase n=1 Tax=Coleophoma cylindrospora TaxID=1849047 RepID=A0A3D8QNK7_9HELO|nr:hypothetical protein BP6252_10813 [Coleophoma cylindrospora]